MVIVERVRVDREVCPLRTDLAEHFRSWPHEMQVYRIFVSIY